jgi:hypothetical protein
MDFVISLPAVHKNAPAMAPGDLEGRNAIIETNQKVLARKLKSESWLGMFLELKHNTNFSKSITHFSHTLCRFRSTVNKGNRKNSRPCHKGIN